MLEFFNNLWGARNRVGMGLSYWPARLHRLAEMIPWNSDSAVDSASLGSLAGTSNRVVVPAS